ncbi:hypothetical protein BN961_00919 [Afipia felis]|uniref:Cysteine rich repeat n=1 Tax=Afipia felis TaxID=1035 RepID=A0A090MMK9_AFIFE|nr:hypothetical protein BN961_00919 [Afipia felis]
MRKVLALAILSIITASPALAAEQCSINDTAITQAGSYVAAVEAVVKSAPDCERAYKTLEICQLGSSGDNALSDIGRKKCEPLFLGKASRGVKAAYKKKLTGCERIGATIRARGASARGNRSASPRRFFAIASP